MIRILPTAAALSALIAGAALAQTPAPAQPQTIGIGRAVSAAEAALGAKAFEAELDRERGALVYEVTLVKDGRAVEADIDAVTGKLVRQGRPTLVRLPWNGQGLRAAQTAPRPLTQTIAMVEEATKGRVSDIALEARGGRHYYEVELVGAQDREVMVDLQTGAISPNIDD